MDTQSIYSFFEKLRVDSISFLYHGFMSDEFTDKIISLSEKNIEKINETKAIRNKVSFLIAESFQNIVRHGEIFDTENTKSKRPGIFILRIVGNTYFISSANLISNINVEKVESQIKQINNLDKDQIKEVYNMLLESSELSEKGGAGLGLIEMARKTGNPLEYDFEKFNDSLSFFYLQIKLNSTTQVNNENEKVPLDATKDFHELMQENNTYLTYKGDFAQSNVLTLLKIIERNLQINEFENESLKSLIFVVLTELLQNISKHCHAQNEIKEGVFLLGKHTGKYVISTGNYIENSKVAAFEERAQSLNKKSREELQALYIHTIKNGELDNFGNAGLGFIEIAKECEKINYNVKHVNETCSFLTISINI